MTQVIACWGICNTASLNVYEIEYGLNDRMLVGINDDEPEWFPIEYRMAEEYELDWSVPGIDFHGSFYRLDECMRVAAFGDFWNGVTV